jgi:hypothetical protein
LFFNFPVFISDYGGIFIYRQGRKLKAQWIMEIIFKHYFSPLFSDVSLTQYRCIRQS